MKTIWLLLMIAMSILVNSPIGTMQKAIDNKKDNSMVLQGMDTHADRFPQLKEDLITKADSTNHYLYIVSKRSALIHDCICSVTMSETHRRSADYQYVNKIVDDLSRVCHFAEYLKKNHSALINPKNEKSRIING